MELADIVARIRVMELTAKSRVSAIRALVSAGHWDDDGVLPEDVFEAVEERESAAKTLVSADFALPHAFIDWEGEFRVVLGRSRQGVDYGAPSGTHVQLIVLLVIGRRLQNTHVEILAALAELLKSQEFRQQLIDAKDVKGLEALLAGKAGLQPDQKQSRQYLPKATTALIRHAVELVESLSAQALLVAVERLENVPWEPLDGWKGRLLIVVTVSADDVSLSREDTHVFHVMHASLSRNDRANLGLLLAASAGLLSERQSVVCVTGNDGKRLDNISLMKPEAHFRAMLPEKGRRGVEIVKPAVMLRVLSLALEISSEGRESHSVGAMFILGDSRNVLRNAQQLVLNPFHGYSKQMRNVLDPSLTETMKEFALIDGAFIIQGDGTVLSAGTYLVPKTAAASIPQGLGARHQTAAAMTSHTQAMAITVSQSTGTVTVFRNGTTVFTLERGSMARW